MLRPESASESSLRRQVRQWLAAHVPEDLRHNTFRPPPERVMPWYRKLSAQGWIAPHWPREHGGMGATPVEQVILMEELARAGAPDTPTQGVNHIGPLLIARGTPAQQRRHLPGILAGDAIWCQGYSEPGAGSDLASLRTRAEVRGDRLVVNGQKIWTTWGHHAHWMFALVRTSGAGKPQHGITFVLVDLGTPGIRRRPIRTLAGDDEFAEVFFDDVEVPLDNVVGDIDQGWRVATAVLSEERLRIGSPALALKALERLRMLARNGSLDADARDVADGLAEAEMAVETLVAAFLAAAESLEEGGQAQAGIRGDSSYLKVLSTETVHRVLDLAQQLAGPSAALREARRHGDDLLDFSQMFLQSRRLGIYGGSNEVQRNIIATRVLGLPAAGRPA
jgi:alkylation response protein AidB-like acyl-CoA dehydrogenase